MGITGALRLIVLLLAAVFVSQCATGRNETSSPGRKTETIADEIRRFHIIAAEDPNLARRARAHLSLARLYSSYRNPSPDYRQALSELEIYMGTPYKSETSGVRNLHAFLRELVRENEEIRKARKALNQCAREKKELRNALEELKKLDIKMEEERKQIR